MEVIQQKKEGPFMLGDVQPGTSQLALECNMYRCVGFPHAVPPSDFLLIRAASGALSVRELTGCIAAGQQEPMRRIPVPGSKECRFGPHPHPPSPSLCWEAHCALALFSAALGKQPKLYKKLFL